MNVSIDCCNEFGSSIVTSFSMSFLKKEQDTIIWSKFRCLFDYLKFLSISDIKVNHIAIYVTEGYKTLKTYHISKSSLDSEYLGRLKLSFVEEYYKHHEI